MPRTMDEESKIKLNIQKRRNNLGFSQTEMARKLDISLTAYRKLESGSTRIFTDSFKAFAQKTETPLSALVAGFEENDATEAKALYDEQLNSIQMDYSRQIAALSSENERLRQTIRDKEDTIEAGKKVISLLERRLSELEKES